MKSFLIISIVLTSFLSFGQERFKVSLQAGIGQYPMSALKNFQKEIESGASFIPLKIRQNFPVYYNYNAEFGLKIFKQLFAGTGYSFQSTGYQSSYADFSGSLKYTQLLKSNSVGIILEFPCWEKDRFTLSSLLRAYYTWTTCEIKSDLTLYDMEIYVFPGELNLTSKSIMINPSIEGGYHVCNQVSAVISLGYCLDFKGELRVSDTDQPVYLLGETLESDWSGFRAGIALQCKF